MIKAVLFDLDGLLIDSEMISYKIYEEIFGEYGHPYSLEKYANEYSGKTLMENAARTLEKYHLPLTLEQLVEKIYEIEAKYIKKEVPLKPGARKLLEYLQEHGYGVAVATSSIKERARMILQSHQIEDYFQAGVFSEDLTKSKPDPEVFLKAAEKLGRKPEECLVLEDSAAGICAACAANIPVICIPDLKEPAEEHLKKAEQVMSDLTEVIMYLEKNN